MNNVAAGEPGPQLDPAPRWSIVDAIVGMVVSVLAAAAIGGIVIASRGDYNGPWAAYGAAAGHGAGQLAGAAAIDRPARTPLWLLLILQVPLWAGLLATVYLAGRKGRGARHDFRLKMLPEDVPDRPSGGVSHPSGGDSNRLLPAASGRSITPISGRRRATSPNGPTDSEWSYWSY